MAHASSSYYFDPLFDETSSQYTGTLRQYYQQVWLRMFHISQQVRAHANEKQDERIELEHQLFKRKHFSKVSADLSQAVSTGVSSFHSQETSSLEQQMQQLIHRITETIAREFEYDTYAQTYFSEALRVLQEQMKGLVFTEEKHYQLLTDFEIQVQNKDIHDMPEVLKEHQQARIYFG